MPQGLTIRQEKFCNFYIESGNASDAYRRAYPNSEKWSDKAVWAQSSLLLNSHKVSIRVEELKKEQAKKSEIKRDEILNMLGSILRGESVTDFIEKTPNGNRARTISKTWAVERICKMLGYDAPIEVTTRTRDNEMTKEQIAAQIKRIRKARGES